MKKRSAEELRIEACRLAVDHLCNEDATPARLMATCVFFEAFLTRGSKWTERHMKLMEPAPKPDRAPVVQLITRDS